MVVVVEGGHLPLGDPRLDHQQDEEGPLGAAEVLEAVGRHLRALHERLQRASEDVPLRFGGPIEDGNT